MSANRVYLSSSCFRNRSVADAVADCLSLGVRHIELSAPHPYEDPDKLLGLLRTWRDEGISLSIHNYFPAPLRSMVLDPAAEGPELEATVALMRAALACAVAAQSPVYAVHAGYLSKASDVAGGEFCFTGEDVPYARALARAQDTLSRLAPEFSAAGVDLLVENLFPSEKRKHSLCCSLSEIEDLLAGIPDSVGLLLDLGHMNISAHLMDFDRDDFLDAFLQRHGHRLREVHISENGGRKDEHRSLECDSWQYGALRRIASASSGRRPLYCLEARNSSLPESLDCMERIAETVFS